MEHILKAAAEAVVLPQHISTHSMRRTFAYHMWHNMGENEYALILVQKMLNHSSPTQTMTYIGVTDAEIAKATMEVNLCERKEDAVSTASHVGNPIISQMAEIPA